MTFLSRTIHWQSRKIFELWKCVWFVRSLSLAQSLLKGANAPIWRQWEPTHMRLSGTEGLTTHLEPWTIVLLATANGSTKTGPSTKTSCGPNRWIEFAIILGKKLLFTLHLSASIQNGSYCFLWSADLFLYMALTHIKQIPLSMKPALPKLPCARYATRQVWILNMI